MSAPSAQSGPVIVLGMGYETRKEHFSSSWRQRNRKSVENKNVHGKGFKGPPTFPVNMEYLGYVGHVPDVCLSM